MRTRGVTNMPRTKEEIEAAIQELEDQAGLLTIEWDRLDDKEQLDATD